MFKSSSKQNEAGLKKKFKKIGKKSYWPPYNIIHVPSKAAPCISELINRLDLSGFNQIKFNKSIIKTRQDFSRRHGVERGGGVEGNDSMSIFQIN